MKRPSHVAEATAGKRILLTQELLQDIGYEDTEVLEMLRSGATLAGDIQKCPVFHEQFKPCLITLQQLESTAPRRNEMILNMTRSSGDKELDQKLLDETREELRCGWAEGPFDPSNLERGASISRRFSLVQGSKTRMIDDFSVSGVNDSCTSRNKIDFHMIDTFAAVVRRYYQVMADKNQHTFLEAKTYDLKSAYRQVPIRESRLKYAYFSVFNWEKGRAEVYRLKTLPFGATHSVYVFLRLARMLYAIMTRALHLVRTNFYDDFLLASDPDLEESSRNSMELVVFMLTGWDFDRQGKKATQFSTVRKALGVCFDLSSSGERLLKVDNTEKRKLELSELIQRYLDEGRIGKQECLVLRGRLGFADSFIHVRLGSVLLKQLSEHAYGRNGKLDPDLRLSLESMKNRLSTAGPRIVSAEVDQQWFIYTDAAYEPESGTGGLGAVLVDQSASIVAWFGIPLSKEECVRFGSKQKEAIIYELELLMHSFERMEQVRLLANYWHSTSVGNQCRLQWFGSLEFLLKPTLVIFLQEDNLTLC